MNIFKDRTPIKNIGNYQVSKDEVVELHRLLWEVKKGLEQAGCIFDLKKYSQLGVRPWLERISKKDHEKALKMLAKILVRDLEFKKNMENKK